MLKKTALSCAMVVGLASGAFAANTDIGELDLLADGYSITKDSIIAGSFSDTYAFSLTQVSDLFGSIDTSFARKLNLVTSDIQWPTLKLYYSSDNSFGEGDSLLSTATIQSINAGLGGSYEVGYIDFSSAAVSGTGFYYFEVTGIAVGDKGGKYDFSATAAPVPEPTAAAMLLAGFAVMGFIAMRRRRQD